VLTVLMLWFENRPWWCACESVKPVTLDAFGAHNSQHLIDPYSITHFAKGLLLAGLLAWALPRTPMMWGAVLVAGLEGTWEVIENSPFVINRYRTETIAQGYQGDAILNSLGDVVCCVLGYLAARRIGLWPAVALFVAIELMLAFWIRDNLALSTVMLVLPIDAVKTWQQAH
jgi:hypothetical protein